MFAILTPVSIKINSNMSSTLVDGDKKDILNFSEKTPIEYIDFIVKAINFYGEVINKTKEEKSYSMIYKN